MSAAPEPFAYLRWRLRRLAGGLLAAAVLLGGGHALARHFLDHRLELVVRAVDERLPGWRLDDLERARTPVPDDENAALAVRAVVAQLPERFPQHFFEGTALPLQGDTLGRTAAVKAIPPLAAWDRLSLPLEQLLRKALGPTEALARQARQIGDYSRGRYAIFHGPDRSTPSPDGLGLRALVFLLKHDTLLRVQERQTSAALANCRAVLVAGRSLGDEPAPAYQVMRLECWDEALTMLDRALTQGQADEAELRRVQQLLEAEAAEPLDWLLLRGELALCHLRYSALEAGQLRLFTSRFSPPVASALDWLARDAVKLSHAGVIDYLAKRADAARLPEPEQTAALRKLDRGLSSDAMVGTWLGEWRGRRLLRFVQNGQLRLQTAAAALAVERYRLWHDRWPESLGALVPDFLARVPDDPYGGGPLLYGRLPDGIVVYSVGRDGRDNGGRINAPADTLGSDLGFRLWDPAER